MPRGSEQYARSLADLTQQAGAIRAEDAQRRGELWGSAVSNIGPQVLAQLTGYRQRKQADEDRAWEHEQRGMVREDRAAALTAAKRAKGEKDLAIVAQDYSAIEEVPPEQRDAALAQTIQKWQQLGIDPGPLAQQPYSSDVAQRLSTSLMTVQQRAEHARQRVAAEEAARHNRAVESGQAGDRALRLTQEQRALTTAQQAQADREADNARQRTAAEETARHNKELERVATMTAGRQAASDAETVRHNTAMEENARNTKIGRPVTAGDAETIADYDTSLDDLNVLAKDMGTTGAESWALSKIPDVLTSWTGWGADAKARQATIDRVKQVIGKALEGGVLRKEDEYKYEKILPKLADAPSVAATKLQGLWNAIQKRRSTRLDALQDAGFNVSQFRARQPRTRTVTSDAGTGPRIGERRTINGQLGEWDGTGWASVTP